MGWVRTRDVQTAAATQHRPQRAVAESAFNRILAQQHAVARVNRPRLKCTRDCEEVSLHTTPRAPGPRARAYVCVCGS